jgi:NAD(P)-dependent dehydrogenase (short-subunit alcohol dehydrogenase family)
MLDVTNVVQIRAAVEKVDALDLLINNAGISLQNDLSDRAALERPLAVNLFGTYDVTQAFLSVLARSRSAIVNILSLAGLAAVPFDSLYSISKAAAFSLSQSLRALLAARGVSVHVVLPGPIDTDMARGLDIPKAAPESVAQAIFDGMENGDEEIFPRSDVGGDRGGLAPQCRQEAPAPVCCVRRTNARQVTGLNGPITALARATVTLFHIPKRPRFRRAD